MSSLKGVIIWLKAKNVSTKYKIPAQKRVRDFFIALESMAINQAKVHLKSRVALRPQAENQ